MVFRAQPGGGHAFGGWSGGGTAVRGTLARFDSRTVDPGARAGRKPSPSASLGGHRRGRVWCRRSRGGNQHRRFRRLGTAGRVRRSGGNANSGLPECVLGGTRGGWVVVPIPFFRRQESPLVFAVAGGVVTLALVVPAAIFVRYAGGGSPLDQPGTFAPLAAAAGLAMLAGTRGRALASPARRVEDGAVTLFPVLSGVLYLQASGAAGAVAAPPPAVWLWAAVTVAGAAFGLSAARPARVVGLALTMVACLLWAVR